MGRLHALKKRPMDGARAVTGRRKRPMRPPFFASVSFEKEMLIKR